MEVMQKATSVFVCQDLACGKPVEKYADFGG